MISINSNLASLIVQSSLKNSTTGVNKAIQRMTTGYKINGAKDNAAGHFISTSLSTKISAYQVAEENVSMGLDMVQTASSSLSQMSDLASRLRSLATQASNGTYDKSSLASIDSEANAIVKEMFRIQSTTSYNGRNLLTSETGGASGIATQSADVAVQSVAVQAASTQSAPKAGVSGFIEKVQKRDTSGMTTLASVDENTELSSGTYSISTAEELAKLATMTNNGKVAEGVEFVLANDIDLSAYSTGEGWTPIGIVGKRFNGIFDGNGYKVKNLYINRASTMGQGLFGYAAGTIKNVGVENANVTGNYYTGALAGNGYRITVSNCYSTGNTTGTGYVGGLVGTGDYLAISDSYSTAKSTANGSQNAFAGGLLGHINYNGTVNNSYATGNVKGGNAGGLVGSGGQISNSYATGDVRGEGNAGGLAGSSGKIVNCFATGTVSGEFDVGGLVGYGGATISNSYATGNVVAARSAVIGGLVGRCENKSNISNCYSTGTVTIGKQGSYNGALLGDVNGSTLKETYYLDTSGLTDGFGGGASASGTAIMITQEKLDELIAQGILPRFIPTSNDNSDTGDGLVLSLQVGINGDDSCQIGLTLSQIDLSSLDGLSMADTSALDTIDSVLKLINEQQTNIGAAENRLTSALEQISVAYDNLVSTRSTIRDADIADESSNYIKMQILQQASATLLATANQNPSIALQLI